VEVVTWETTRSSPAPAPDSVLRWATTPDGLSAPKTANRPSGVSARAGPIAGPLSSPPVVVVETRVTVPSESRLAKTSTRLLVSPRTRSARAE
jgi:hypothetical protein